MLPSRVVLMLRRWGFLGLWLVVLVYLFVVIDNHQQRIQRTEGGLPGPMIDFTPTYGGALQLSDLPLETLYERQPVMAYSAKALKLMYPALDEIWLSRLRYPPWMYPPHFFLLILPLVLLPFWWAYGVWLAATATPYLWTMRSIVPPLRWALPLALVMPPVFYNLIHGQFGFWIAGCLGLGLIYARRHPWLAGLAIGLLSMKPHFGLLIPVALAAGGYWRAMWGSALAVAGLIMVSAVVLGVDAWAAFLPALSNGLDGVASGQFSYTAMVSIFSMLMLFDVNITIVRGIQYVALLLMVATVSWAWWQGKSRPDTDGLQAAIVCLATPLALPMVYIYDLVILGPAIAWIGLDLYQQRAHWGGWLLLLVPTLLLFLLVTIADHYDIQLGPLPIMVLLGLTIYRLQQRLTNPVDP